MKTNLKKQKFWLNPLLLVGLLCGILFLALQSKDGAGNFTAHAEENGATTAVYLPLVNNLYPFTTIFGTEMNPIVNAQGLEKMTAAGANWVRRNGVLWSMVEPVHGGGYDWSALASLEDDLLNARSNNMEVILIVRGLPSWATSAPFNYACGPMAPGALPDFGNFMAALVARYSGAPYFVKYWEIWNEPDVDPSLVSSGNSGFGCMGDQTDTSYYGGQAFAAVLQTASVNAKAVDPEAEIVVGGLLMDCDPVTPPIVNPGNPCTSSKFLEGILAAGGQDYFDGVSFHAYDYFSQANATFPNGIYGNPGWNSGGAGSTLYGDLKPVVIAKTEYIKDLLASYGAADKFLINTETGLICGAANDVPGGPGCEADSGSDFEKLKAAYVPQTYAAALAEGLLANVWYTPLGWRNSGLLNSDLSSRPAYDAYVLARDTLKLTEFVRELSEFSGDQVFGYEFQSKQGKIWVLWALDGQSHTITLPGSPVAAWDELGNPVSSAGTLTVGALQTLYVDWGP